MEQIKVKAKKWGNSMAVVIPANIVNKESIEEGTELMMTLDKKKISTVGDLMELGRKMKLREKMKRPVDELMREIDKELWGIEK
jgi:antitoxin component of MazEF toxin-antitoxin module